MFSTFRLAKAEQSVAGWAELSPHHKTGVLEGSSERLAGVGVPEPSGAVLARRHEPVPVRRKVQMIAPSGVPQRWRERFSPRGRPDPRRAVG